MHVEILTTTAIFIVDLLSTVAMKKNTPMLRGFFCPKRPWRANLYHQPRLEKKNESFVAEKELSSWDTIGIPWPWVVQSISEKWRNIKNGSQPSAM